MELKSSLKPLRVVSQIMGINVNFKFGRFYTATVFLIVILLCYASYANTIDDNKDDDTLSGVDSLILWTQLLSNVIFTSVVLGVCIIKPGQFLFPIKEMKEIDNGFRFLGGKIDGRYLYRKQFVQFFIWLVFLILITSRDVYKIFQQGSLLLFFGLMHYSYSISMSMLTDCLFANYLGIIKQRFSILNELLRGIVETNNKLPNINFALIHVTGRSSAMRNNNANYCTPNIERLRLLHHDLCLLSKKVNRSFGLQQLLSTGITLIMITGELYESYHYIRSINNPLGFGFQKIMWLTFYVTRIFHISYACSSTSFEASFTASIIHGMSVQKISNAIGNQMQHFSVQLIHENLNFNACGFFVIDFTLVCSIVGVVSTYLVILIQIDRKTHTTHEQ